jgi:hypothetical protein
MQVRVKSGMFAYSGDYFWEGDTFDAPSDQAVAWIEDGSVEAVKPKKSARNKKTEPPKKTPQPRRK